MSRTVFSNDELPHIFANRAAPEGRNSGRSFRFDGPDIYSYSTRIGSRYETRKGSVLLLTSATYSVTTSRHVSRIIQAFRGHGRVIHAADLGGGHQRISALAHKVNREYFRRTIGAAVLAAGRARTRAGWHLETAIRAAKDARFYCEAFGISARQFPESEILELEAAADSPELVARVTAATVAKEVKRSEAEKVARKRAAAKQAKERAAKIAAWLAGESVQYPSAAYGDPCQLRTVGDTVETSQGATVPLSPALGMYALLTAGHGGTLVGQSIGHYAVSRVESDRIVIGCHTIMFEEVERWATVQGVAVSPPLTSTEEG